MAKPISSEEANERITDLEATLGRINARLDELEERLAQASRVLLFAPETPDEEDTP